MWALKTDARACTRLAGFTTCWHKLVGASTTSTVFVQSGLYQAVHSVSFMCVCACGSVCVCVCAWLSFHGLQSLSTEQLAHRLSHVLCSTQPCAYLLSCEQVTTEGDAFIVAFHDPLDAIGWALHVQLAFLEAPWPPELLQHPQGRVETCPEGKLLFRGLRVRAAINTGIPAEIIVSANNIL